MKSKPMLFIAFAIGLICAYAVYNVYLFWNAAQRSAPLIAATPPFNLNDPSRTRNILVLGDSLAVGVGAPAGETVAGRLSKALNANVDNVAKSGALTRDLEGQMVQAHKSRYDLILIQAGANDIIQLKSLSSAEANMDTLLAEAKQKSDYVAFLLVGDVGAAPLWPWPWPRIYSTRSHNLRERYIALAQKRDALFVDIYSRDNIFANDPDRYYANDQLHLTADGYEKWFEIISDDVRAKWPELQ